MRENKDNSGEGVIENIRIIYDIVTPADLSCFWAILFWMLVMIKGAKGSKIDMLKLLN